MADVWEGSEPVSVQCLVNLRVAASPFMSALFAPAMAGKNRWNAPSSKAVAGAFSSLRLKRESPDRNSGQGFSRETTNISNAVVGACGRLRHHGSRQPSEMISVQP
jgi:hypothetical protein